MTDPLSLLTVAVGLVVIWLAISTVLLFRLSGHYNHLTKDITDKDLKTILEKILTELNINKEQTHDLKKEIGGYKAENLGHFQKIGFIRFNPFPETGGNQSFCLAILDGKDNGVVLSSLHSRESTRIYAKTIKAGKAKDYDLSSEEKQAVLLAEKGKS
jgi:hypothetical protein